MRALVDLPDRQLVALAAMCASTKISKAEIIRRASSLYIDQHGAGTDDTFGILKGAPEEGLGIRSGCTRKGKGAARYQHPDRFLGRDRTGTA